MTDKTLIQKLLEVSDAIRYIEKGGTNSAQNYKFVGEAQVVEKVQPLFKERGILAYPQHRLAHEPIQFTTAKGSVQFLTTTISEWVFTDGKDSIEVVTIGQGTDAGDKGAYKAMTGAKKYGLLQALMIATGDDPEEARPDEKDEQASPAVASARGSSGAGGGKSNKGPTPTPTTEAKGNPDAPITEPQKRLIRAKAKEHNVTNEQLGELRLKVTKKHSSAQMTNADVDALLNVLGDVAEMAAILTGGEVAA